MSTWSVIFSLSIGIICGGAITAFILQQKLSRRLTELQVENAQWRTRLESEEKATAEKTRLLQEAEQRLEHTFKALSADALKHNNEAFLTLARTTLEQAQQKTTQELEQRKQAVSQLVQPVQETLTRLDQELRNMEKTRAGAYEGLQQQVRSLLESQNQLRTETGNLVKALRAPQVRGRWGEMQLKRVVEMAGMLAYCDFEEQVSTSTDQGVQRPDLIVRLPAGKNIVVDAKAPLSAYLDALEATDEVTRTERLKDHARQIREHLTRLGKKNYFEQFQPAPEFVVLFLPGETFFSAALEQDPTLIEQGVEQRVILATPTTLISLLKAVAYGWRQEKLAENAQQISDLGRELHKRVGDMGGHLAELGNRINKSVEAFNKTVGTFETRVLVTTRKFEELESSGTSASLPEIDPIDLTTRTLKNHDS